jgi:hypothetical protein
MSHVKRVRCKKCGELTGFKSNGKYGRIRKEIAIAISNGMDEVMLNAF